MYIEKSSSNILQIFYLKRSTTPESCFELIQIRYGTSKPKMGLIKNFI